RIWSRSFVTACLTRVQQGRTSANWFQSLFPVVFRPCFSRTVHDERVGNISSTCEKENNYEENEKATVDVSIVSLPGRRPIGDLHDSHRGKRLRLASGTGSRSQRDRQVP